MTKKILLLLLVAPLSFSLQAQVQKMVKDDPKATATCVVKNKATRAELKALFEKGKAEQRINARENSSHAATEKNIDDLQKKLEASGLTTQECQTISIELDKERAAINQMLASANRTSTKPPPDPRVIACVKANRAKESEIKEAFKAATAAGKISQDEKNGYQSALASVEKMEKSSRSGGYTLEECDKVSAGLARVEKGLKQMSAK
jgi:hypothetical protein